MSLFDGMGFGDGYCHSASRRSMRGDYIHGSNVGPLTKSDVIIALAVLGTTAIMAAYGTYKYLEASRREPQPQQTIDYALFQRELFKEHDALVTRVEKEVAQKHESLKGILMEVDKKHESINNYFNNEYKESLKNYFNNANKRTINLADGVNETVDKVSEQRGEEQ